MSDALAASDSLDPNAVVNDHSPMQTQIEGQAEVTVTWSKDDVRHFHARSNRRCYRQDYLWGATFFVMTIVAIASALSSGTYLLLVGALPLGYWAWRFSTNPVRGPRLAARNAPEFVYAPITYRVDHDGIGMDCRNGKFVTYWSAVLSVLEEHAVWIFQFNDGMQLGIPRRTLSALDNAAIRVAVNRHRSGS